MRGPGCPTTAPASAQRAGVRARRRPRPTARPRPAGASLAPPPAHRGRPRPAGAGRRRRATAPRRRARGGRTGAGPAAVRGRRARRCWRTGCPPPRRRGAVPHRPGAAGARRSWTPAVTLAADVHADADAAAVRAHRSRRDVDRACGAGSAPGTRPVVAQVGGGGGGRQPAGSGLARKRRLAARRTSAKPCPRSWSRKRSKSSPGASVPEARVHSVPSVIRLEIAVPPGKGAAAKSARPSRARRPASGRRSGRRSRRPPGGRRRRCRPDHTPGAGRP